MPHRFSARMVPNQVTVFSSVRGQDTTGETLTWPGPGVVLPASVQMIDPTRRFGYQGGIRSEADAVAYFLDPLATKVDDRLTWQVAPGDPTQDRSFGILGPATPEAGRGSLYVVPLKEVR